MLGKRRPHKNRLSIVESTVLIGLKFLQECGEILRPNLIKEADVRILSRTVVISVVFIFNEIGNLMNITFV